MQRSLFVAVLVAAACAAPHKRQYTSDPPVDQQAAVDTHNYYRSLHGVGPVRWGQRAADAARDWVKGCYWPHPDDNSPYGQNVLYSGVADGIQAVIDYLYTNEVNNYASYYGLAQPPPPPPPVDDSSSPVEYGHFAAIVWKNTTRVGCYTAFCPVLANSAGVNVYFTACNYYKAGLVEGQWAENVLPPLS